MREASMRSRLRQLAGLAIAASLAVPTAVSAKSRHHPHPRGGPFQHVAQATATGSGGAAASVDSVATRAAIDALRRGGNAVDAAVPAAAVLGVTEPFSCGVGGGGFMLIRTPDGRITTIDGRETAPAAMQPGSFIENGTPLAIAARPRAPAAMQPGSFIENGTPLAFADARWSGLSAGVPGTVATWDLALRRYGTWRLGRALEAGINVARRGFVIDQTFFDQTRGATNTIPTGETADYFD